jgi:hypothetical protein
MALPSYEEEGAEMVRRLLQAGGFRGSRGRTATALETHGRERNILR